MFSYSVPMLKNYFLVLLPVSGMGLLSPTGFVRFLKEAYIFSVHCVTQTLHDN